MINYRYYFFRWIAVVAILSLSIIAASTFTWFSNIGIFSWVALVFLAGISQLTMLLLFRGIKNKSNHQFIGMVSASTTIKLLCSAFFIVIWAIAMHPTNAFFIIPFFLFYIVFTVFDVGLMLKLIKQEKNNVTQKS